MVKKYYQLLEVNENASATQIKKAYYGLAQKYHPDKRPADTERFKEIGVAYGVLSDSEKKEFYDLYGDNWEDKFKEAKEGLLTCSKPKCGKKLRVHEKGRASIGEKNDEKWFCSRQHTWDYLDEKKKERERERRCRNCGNENCYKDKCGAIKNYFSEIELLSFWEFFTQEQKDQFFEEIKQIGRDLTFPSEEFDRQINKKVERIKNLNKAKENAIKQERNKYITKLKNLKGWTTLAEERQKALIESMERNRTTSQFQSVLQEVEKEIKIKQGGEGGGGDKKPTSIEIQQAISEIESELNKEPKITMRSESWRTYFAASSSLDELKDRKQEILNHLQNLRKGREQNQKKGNLAELKTYIAFLIRQELNQNPPVSSSELTKPNWEVEISQAQSENDLVGIQNRLLAEIRSKRAGKKEQSFLTQLLKQAHNKENWNNYQNLESILRQIKKLRSSTVYETKKSEIQVLESRLQELDPTKFKGSIENLLNQQVKDNGLNESNLNKETKEALEEAKRDPTPEKIAKAEEKISQNGADNSLSSLLNNIETKLKKGNLKKEEKDKLAVKLLNFIAKNKYHREAYKKMKSKSDQLLSELQGGEGNKNSETPWLKTLGIVALIGLSLIVAIIIIWRIWLNKRRKFR